MKGTLFLQFCFILMLKIKFENPQKGTKEGLRFWTSFDQNNMGPSQKGSFRPYLPPVELDLKFKKKLTCPTSKSA